ncbi:MAG: hypothetical protein C4306_05900 [Thermoleophilia bacterium]
MLACARIGAVHSVVFGGFSAEALADDPEAAAQAAVQDVRPHDDALASAWYRQRALPVLVRRVLFQLKEAV